MSRSEMMGRIRSSDTKPEMVVRRGLHSHGFRFRLHRKDLAGKPDLVLVRHGVVIFVHGCFWH
ncbi:MAG: very short patch repair endonuclease, partial [Hyphomicrobiales bacterium]